MVDKRGLLADEAGGVAAGGGYQAIPQVSHVCVVRVGVGEGCEVGRYVR